MADDSVGCGCLALLVIGGLWLFSGSKPETSATLYEAGSGFSSSFVEEREDFDEDAAREAAEADLASETYQDNGATYGCTVDCSGHEAGWQWRDENGYAAKGNSQSFSEGGQAFDEAVDDRVEELRSDYEDGEEPDYWENCRKLTIRARQQITIEQNQSLNRGAAGRTESRRLFQFFYARRACHFPETESDSQQVSANPRSRRGKRRASRPASAEAGSPRTTTRPPQPDLVTAFSFGEADCLTC